THAETPATQAASSTPGTAHAGSGTAQRPPGPARPRRCSWPGRSAARRSNCPPRTECLGASPGAKPRLHDLATLSSADALRLDGRRGLFRISLDSTEGEYDGFILYDCRSPDAVLRSVRLYPGQEDDDEMVVETTLRVVRHPASGAFPALIESRLTQAV